jgi:hypothetical protein
MRLSPLQLQEVVNYLEIRQPKECAVCGKASRVVSQIVFEMSEFMPRPVGIGSFPQTFGVIPVTCKNCGAVVLVSATEAGVIQNLSGHPKPANENEARGR